MTLLEATAMRSRTPRSQAARVRVLAAVDLGPRSDDAIREAAALASRTGGELAAVHVLPEPHHGMFWRQHEGDVAKVQRLTRRAEDIVSARITAVTGRGAGVFVEQGTAQAGITRAANAWHADVVVLGGWGAVAHRVLRHAHCDVLVARPHAGAGLVLAAIDPSYASNRALRVAATEARRRTAGLEVVRAMGFFEVEAAYLVELGTPALHASEHRTRDVARHQLAESLASLGIDGTAEIVDPPAAAGIVSEAERIGAELIVVGHHDRPVGIGVAEKVARAAPCSVLVVRG